MQQISKTLIVFALGLLGYATVMVATPILVADADLAGISAYAEDDDDSDDGDQDDDNDDRDDDDDEQDNDLSDRVNQTNQTHQHSPNNSNVSKPKPVETASVPAAPGTYQVAAGEPPRKLPTPPSPREALGAFDAFIDQDMPRYRDNIILAAYSGCQSGEAAALQEGLSIRSDYCLQGANIRLIEYELHDLSFDKAAVMLNQQANLLWLQRDFFYQSAAKSSAANAANAYAFDITGLAQTPSQLRGQSVTIGLIDTLVDTTHKELVGAAITQHNIFDFSQTDKHATAISSILVGRNKLRGLVPEARLISIPAFDVGSQHEGQRISSSVYLAKALDRMLASQVDVLNLSFVGPHERLVEALISAHVDSGTMVIAAGGNGNANGKGAAQGQSALIYPAAYPSVIGVGAVDANKQLYVHGTTGSHIDFVAPGVDILVATPGDRYGFVSGSSFATAYVSGLKALLLEEPQRRDRILPISIEHAEDLGAQGKDAQFGHGLIQTPW